MKLRQLSILSLVFALHLSVLGSPLLAQADFYPEHPQPDTPVNAGYSALRVPFDAGMQLGEASSTLIAGSFYTDRASGTLEMLDLSAISDDTLPFVRLVKRDEADLYSDPPTGRVADSLDSTAFSCDQVSGIPQGECQALVALYNRTNGPGWTNRAGWLASNAPCSWYGVTCQGGHISKLDLYRNQLAGSIPSELGILTGMQELTLSWNQLSGGIPSELGGLVQLTELNLEGNKLLTGTIPLWACNLHNLQMLSLTDNQLHGTIPSCLGSLTNLTWLSLFLNQFTGGIPKELGNLTRLTFINLQSNQLTGGIPPEFGNLTNLTMLYLHYNQLSGSIPPQLGNLTKLERLGLNGNQFTGAIPPEFGNLQKLQQLGLDVNRLEGAIPQELGNLTSVYNLVIANNALSGEIPSTITKLVNLNNPPWPGYPTWSDINYNKLSASDPAVVGFLNSKLPGWSNTQTVPPTALSATGGIDAVDLNWNLIPYTQHGGYYEIGVATTPVGPFGVYGHTSDKSASSFRVLNLKPGTTYYLAMRTYTSAHGSYSNGIFFGQQNDLTSAWSQVASATTRSPSISHVEITQATQNESNTVPLIAGKPTFVRVYVDCGDGCSEMSGVTGILRGYGTSGELPKSPKLSLNNSIVARHEDWRNQRGDLGKTLNFTIPPEWTSGTVTLRAEVSGATRSEAVTFVDARQPNVIYVPVHFDSTDPSSRIDDAFSWARQNWPTSRVNYLRWPVFNWSPNLLCRLSADCLKADLKTKLTELYWQGQVGGYIFGWLANGAESRLGVWGSSDPAWNGGYGKAAFGVDHPIDGPVIFTHEMAHLMGRHHPDSADSCVPGIDPNSDWPHDNARIQQWGLDGYGFGWLIGSASALKDPANTYDYMSYCWANDRGAKPTWTSPWTFERIYEQTLRPTAATFASQLLAEPTPYFAVSGLVFSNATATLNPAWIITPTLAPDNPPAGVGYCLEVQDATSAVLTSRCIDLTFVDYDTGAPTNVRGFNLALPYLPNAKRLVLKKGASELAVQPVSDRAPVINVVSPNGGETWAASGTYTITWTASDLDTDPLTYSVLYSPDGNDWVPIGTAITTTQLAVNAAELAGGTAARVRVLTTDGVNTSSDESDTAFTVGRKGPNVSILAPAGDVRFLPGTPLWLQGHAYDLEDGTLEGPALRWRSDRDGDLASGEQALVTLSPGQHTITLTATDSQGNPATASINVFAGGRTHLPLVVR